MMSISLFIILFLTIVNAVNGTNTGLFEENKYIQMQQQIDQWLKQQTDENNKNMAKIDESTRQLQESFKRFQRAEDDYQKKRQKWLHVFDEIEKKKQEFLVKQKQWQEAQHQFESEIQKWEHRFANPFSLFQNKDNVIVEPEINIKTITTSLSDNNNNLQVKPLENFKTEKDQQQKSITSPHKDPIVESGKKIEKKEQTSGNPSAINYGINYDFSYENIIFIGNSIVINWLLYLVFESRKGVDGINTIDFRSIIIAFFLMNLFNVSFVLHDYRLLKLLFGLKSLLYEAGIFWICYYLEYVSTFRADVMTSQFVFSTLFSIVFYVFI